MRRRTRWSRSLGAQLVLWAALPITLAIVGLALLGVYAHERDMRDFVVERDQALADSLAWHLEDALLRGALSRENQSMSDWLAASTASLHAEVWIVDQDARILARSATKTRTPLSVDLAMLDIWDKAHGTVQASDASAGPIVVTFTAIESDGLRVVTLEPIHDVMDPILRLSALGPIAAAIGLLLSILLLVFGWFTIARPLRRLSRATNAVTWNAQMIHEAPLGAVAEIEDLHRALAGMMDRLEGYRTGLLDLLGATTRGQEEERARLARELHDGPVQGLIALVQRIELAQHRVERAECDSAIALLENLRAAEIGVIEDLRRTIGALRPAYLDDLGFIPALEQLVAAESIHHPRTDAHVSLEVIGTIRRLHPDLELAAYRIVQEALSNALQHASATHVTVAVRWEDEALLLEVRDDGVGFEQRARFDTYTRQGHFGLVGLQERARQLGGTLTLETAYGRGTTITVRLPILDDLPGS